ncbi:MAG: glycosyltransferase family 2 protein [Candidatus Bathyarchaeia archaeon]|jgi:glycosyltransferase involved in cell wall biosynthesis
MVEVQENSHVLINSTAAQERPFVVVGIPAFNEERAIARIIIEAQKFADAVVVCDDGSSDLTANIAERLGAEVARHPQNMGYGAAIKTLFQRALDFGADVLVTLDGDGQHDASEIPQVIQPIINGSADVVIGSRFIDQQGTKEMPRYRRFGAKVITKLVNGSSKTGVKDSQSGFRAYNRQALERLCVSEAGMGASVQILLEASKQDLRISEVASTCKYETGGGSTSTENPFTHGVGVIMSLVRLIVEQRPLTVLGIPGLFCLFGGIGFGVWMLQLYATTHAIVTNVALAALAFTIIGFFMLSTAITLYAITRISKKVTD